MADPKGFLKHDRQVAERRPVDERIQDWNEVYPGGIGRALLPIITEQAGRCMDCGIPFCHQGCPLGNIIPELIVADKKGTAFTLTIAGLKGYSMK